MNIYHYKTYVGSSIYSTEPVMVFLMDTQPGDIDAAPDQISRVRDLFADWFEWTSRCSMVDAAVIGEFLVQFALQSLNEVRGRINTAKCLPGANVTLVLGYHDTDTTRIALKLAASILTEISLTPEIVLKGRMDKFWKRCRITHPDYQAGLLIDAARSMDVPVLRVAEKDRFWQYGWGRKSRVFLESASTEDGLVGHMITTNKVRTNKLLRSLGVPVPVQSVVHLAEQLQDAISSVKYPCAVKPVDGGGGKGVTAGIRSQEELRAAFHVAEEVHGGPVIVEEFVHGDDYRLIVIEGRCVAVVRKWPARVEGDGNATVRQLIDELNHTRTRNIVRSRYRRPVLFDATLESHLAIQGWSLDDVVPPGVVVILRSNANLSTGGLSDDVTESVNREVCDIVEQLSATLGLATAGFDYRSLDISTSPRESGGKFLEVNTTPGLDGFTGNSTSSHHVACKVLGSKVGRIPVDLEIVPKLEEISHDLLSSELEDGGALVIGDLVRIGTRTYCMECGEPWSAVNSVLLNRAIDRVRLVTTANDIVEYGLPVDKARSVTVRGALFNGEWVDVLRRHCDQISFL